MNTSRRGHIKVHCRVLSGLLRLPNGCEVEAITQTFEDMRSGIFHLYLKGEPMPLVDCGASIPHMIAKYTKRADGELNVQFEEVSK